MGLAQGSGGAAAVAKGGNMSGSQEKGLGKKLAVLAKLKGLTQDQIAKRCSMSRISVNRFFCEHTEIRAGDLNSLLQTLGISLDDLIDRAIEAQMNGSRSAEESLRFTVHSARFETDVPDRLVAGQVLIPRLAAS